MPHTEPNAGTDGKPDAGTDAESHAGTHAGTCGLRCHALEPLEYVLGAMWGRRTDSAALHAGTGGARWRCVPFTARRA